MSPSATYVSALEDIETRLFINNEFVPSISGKQFEVVNPANEEVVTSVYEADSDDVNIAVKAAKEAASGWADIGAMARAAMLYKLADLVMENQADLAALDAICMGTPVGFGLDALYSSAYLRYCAGLATQVQGDTSLHNPGVLAMTLRQPFGVCAAIIPWNIPTLAFIMKFAPAMATGNTLILKSSEKAPLSALYIAKLIQSAGFPPGVINILSGYGKPCGDAMARHMEIRKLSFTGSGPTGKAIRMAAADSNLKNVTLELGGKSPLIVFDDADLEKAVPAATSSILNLSGQACMASSRVYVHSSIADQFIDKMKIAFHIQGANPEPESSPFSKDTKRGPQVDKIQFDRVMGYLGEIDSSNGKVLLGGRREGSKGYYIQPTLIFQPDENSRIMKEEIFGPVVCVNTFEDEEDVLRRANDTEFGLYASVFTKDLARAMRVAKKCEAGTVGVNVTSPFVTLDSPFGGWKQSGDGRELSKYALDAWTELKTVYIAS